MSTIPTPHHIGIVVADLDKAMSELTELLGLQWLPVVRSGHQSLGPHGAVIEDPAAAPLLTMSRQGPPYLELLELVPGTIWSHPGPHHLGYWSADAHNDSARMTAQGFPVQAAAVTLDGDTEPGVFYHRTSDALNLELVEMSRGAPAFAHYLNLPATDL